MYEWSCDGLNPLCVALNNTLNISRMLWLFKKKNMSNGTKWKCGTKQTDCQ